MSMKSKYKSSYKRRSTKSSNRMILLILSAVLFCGVLGAGIFLVLRINSKDAPEAEKKLLTVYVAKEDIERGYKITASQLEEKQVIPEMSADYYCTMACFDQVAAVDIPIGMPVLKNMICSPEIEEGQREVECEVVSLSENLVDNDYVDVRIMMPNGEDYIVLAKKSVHDLSRSEDDQEERCYLWMSEDEILYYSAAIVDAYLYPGSSLYTTRYIEPAIQEPSITTYVPSIGTITMMKENPNLLQEAIGHLKENNRKQLENRLTYYLNKDIREVLWSEADSSLKESTVDPASKSEEDTTQNNQSNESISVKDDKTEANNIGDEVEPKNDTKTGDSKVYEDALSVFIDKSKLKGVPVECKSIMHRYRKPKRRL